MRFRKKNCGIFTGLAILCYHLVCGCGETKPPYLMEVQRVLKMEKIRSPNDVWKGYLKTWDQ